MEPKYSFQFVSPATFLGIEAFLQAIENCFVYCFCLSNALGVPRRGFAESNHVFVAESFEPSRDELGSVVGNDFIRNPVAIYDVFLDEVFHLCVLNAGE